MFLSEMSIALLR